MSRKKFLIWLLSGTMTVTAMGPGNMAMVTYAEDASSQTAVEETTGEVQEDGSVAVVTDDSSTDVQPGDNAAEGVEDEVVDGDLDTGDNGQGGNEDGSSLIEDDGTDAGDEAPGIIEGSAAEADSQLAFGDATYIGYGDVDSGLKISTADGKRSSYTVDPGESVTFKARATVDPSMEDQTIRYEWYENYEKVGEGDSFTIDHVDKPRYLHCYAYDGYNNYTEMWFSASVTAKWHVRMYKGSDVIAVGYGRNVGNATVKYGDSLTLKTEAYGDGADDAGLTYHWFPEKLDNGNEGITGEGTDQEFTVSNITKQQTWECDVTDKYDNVERVYCAISIDTGLTLTTDCGTKNGYAYEIQTDATSYTLRIHATTDEHYADQPLHYQWTSTQVDQYVRNLKEGDVDSADQDITLTIDDLEHEYAELSCEVTDCTGSSKYMSFKFLPNDDFTVKDRTFIKVYSKAAQTKVDIDAASDAQVDVPDAYGYHWSYNDQYGSQVYPANDEKYMSSVFEYTIPYDHTVDHYMCNIADRFSRRAVENYYLVNEDRLQTVSYENGEFSDPADMGGTWYRDICKVDVDESGTYRLATSDWANNYTLLDASGNAVPFETSDSSNDNYYDNEEDRQTRNTACENGIEADLQAGMDYYLIITNYERNTYQTVLEHALPKHEHTGEWVVVDEPTCEDEGYEVYCCSDPNCGEILDDMTIDPLGHDWGEGKVTRASACGSTGVKTYTCSRCGKTRTETIPATGSHSFGAWTRTAEPTIFAQGQETRTCSVCGRTETRSIAKLPAAVSLSAGKVTLKARQKTNGVKVTEMSAGDFVASVTSSNSKIVKASVNGTDGISLQAGKKTGNATVTVTMKSGASAEVRVKVQKKNVTTKKITVTSGRKITLRKGKKSRIKAVVQPFTSLEKITYKSSNTSVATVTRSGIVKATGKGKAVITVSSGKKKVKVTVIVR